MNDGLKVNFRGFGGIVILGRVQHRPHAGIEMESGPRRNGLTSASASFFALEEPDASSGSSSGSSFFSFLAPPPNMEKTLSLTPAAAEVADEAALPAISVYVAGVDPSVAVASGWADLGSLEAACSSVGSGFVSVFADMLALEIVIGTMAVLVLVLPVDSEIRSKQWGLVSLNLQV